MLLRVGLLLAAVVFAGCSRPLRSGESLLPATVAQVWQRRSLRDKSPAVAHARRAFEADYEGPGKLTADLYDLNSSEQGLDLAQRWKPAANTVFFYSGSYFVVIKWEQGDWKSLQAFVRELQKQLGNTKP